MVSMCYTVVDDGMNSLIFKGKIVCIGQSY